MYHIFLTYLYSPHVKNINYKDFLASYAIYFYTRVPNIQTLLLSNPLIVLPYAEDLIPATELNPTNPQLLTSLGIHYTIGDSNPDKALKYLNQSIAISANGYNGLAYSFKAWNLFLKYASDGDNKKANLTAKRKKKSRISLKRLYPFAHHH